MSYQGSPGFMYFNVDNNSKEESDYLSFSESNASYDNTFSPSAISSPQDYSRKSPRVYNNSNGRRGRRHHNFNNYSRTPNNFRRNYSNNSYLNKSQDNAYSKYMHPSFTENPWRYLEKSNECKNETEEVNAQSEQKVIAEGS